MWIVAVQGVEEERDYRQGSRDKMQEVWTVTPFLIPAT
jgi:hypothetical protein